MRWNDEYDIDWQKRRQRMSNGGLKMANNEYEDERVTAPMLEIPLFGSLIETNTRTRMNPEKQKRDDKNVYMQKCVKACEGMSEDMPVTYLPTSEKR